MSAKNLLSALLCIAFVFVLQSVYAQDKLISGKIIDSKDGSPVAGATVQAKGTKTGTSTKADGSFSLNLAPSVTMLVISSVGYETQEITIGGKSAIDVAMVPAAGANLNEVVVTGYGTARKKDLTGAIGSVKSKDFNKGIQTNPQQLIQGKIAGVQVVEDNGAPGASVSIRIRGNASLRTGNSPLYVVDGVPLSNTSTRPGIDLTDVGGSTPGGNIFNFLNPADIASIDVLKDASAAAIYGSRGANGVIMITTKRGQSGVPKVDVNASVGFAKIAKQLEVLDGDKYRQALGDFGFPTSVYTPANPTANFGSSVDALGSILQTGMIQNYGVALSGGNDNGRYRLSFSYLDKEGIIRKTDLKKYTIGFNSNFRFLQSRKLGLDVNMLTSQTVENIAPISNNAGFKGSLIGQALQWNPTKALHKSDGTLLIEYGSDNINPLAYSEAYTDKARITTVIANFAPYYKITDALEFKTQMSITYSTGARKQYTSAYINITDVALNTTTGKGGEANVAQNDLVTTQITHTLSYVKDISTGVNLNAVLGYEYLKTKFSGNSMYARGFIPTDKPYYYFMSSSDPSTRKTNGFADPNTELQSVFARVMLNLKDRFLFTGTMRADGSSKFGKDNKYGYFPSVGAAWNISRESFLQGTTAVRNLKLRASWGVTGNQEFPAGASQLIYSLNGSNPATFSQTQIANPALKWESTTTTNIGLDFTIFNGKLNGSIDYFNRNTEDILFPRDAADPVTPNSAVKWTNIDGNIVNTGLEVSLNSTIIKKANFSWDLGVNVTFQDNELKNFVGEIPTGEVNGQGLSGAYAQLIKSGFPINTFYLKKFIGIDKATGISLYEGGEAKFMMGAPNPKFLLGINTTLMMKKFSLEIAMNGAYGHYIYNNTANAVTSFNNIGKRNIGEDEYALAKSLGEKPVNPTSASSRYLEKGDYLRLANATLSYNMGNIGKSIKGANIYVTAQNLFVITDFSGFDPEVNVSKPMNGVPSFGMEYTPYPTARTISFGINFSL
jgi:TonB-dependent starch-binding outer membrane protein SusC